MKIKEWLSLRIFNAVHRNNLVYNTCWEDPRLDRQALEFGPDDNVMVITSAGCNALDYALAGPRHVYAVDVNPCQNALLQLKQSAIKELEFDQFFEMFGHGYLPGSEAIYNDRLRRNLSAWSRSYWDKRIKWFDNRHRSFYFRGTSGCFARLMKIYMDQFLKVRPQIDEMINAQTLDEQRDAYYNRFYDKFWTRLVKFTMNRDTTLSMLGVPKAQRKQIEDQYPGGLIKYLQDCVEGVCVNLPMRDNYFWRVYINGSYTRKCCPEYLKEEQFNELKNGLIDRISTHTDSVQGFLEKHEGQISRFILLDHMDWLSDHFFPSLKAEWQTIVDRAAQNARLIWRSGGLCTDFIDHVQVHREGKLTRVNELLTYHTDLARELHEKDRVHTYASFYIADLSA